MVPWELWRGMLNVCIFWEEPFWMCTFLAILWYLLFFFNVSSQTRYWNELKIRFLRCTVKQASCVGCEANSSHVLSLFAYLPHCLNYKTSVILKCLWRDWTDEGKRGRSKPVRFRINCPPEICHSCENIFLCQAMYPWKIYITSSMI